MYAFASGLGASTSFYSPPRLLGLSSSFPGKLSQTLYDFEYFGLKQQPQGRVGKWDGA
jgi:hypothetical protein